jgi:hypothetical protein
MSFMNKCYGILPLNGMKSGNLIQEIGAVEDAQICQRFCKELYPGKCTWFIFDRTTSDCKLFHGSVADLRNDCREIGYAVQPSYTECNAVFANTSDNKCYNFREDYCRFEFNLLDNLEDIQSLSECQKACQYLTNCTYFVYSAPKKVCKVHKTVFEGGD